MNGFETSSDGSGFYCAENFQQNSHNHLDHHMAGGEAVKIYFEPELPVGDREPVMIKVIPKSAPSTFVEFSTPDIRDVREYLYPA